MVGFMRLMSPNSPFEEVLPEITGSHRVTRFTLRTVEMQTYVGDHQRFLVRADLEITPSIQVFPFEIKAISGPLIWRAKFSSHRIGHGSPILNVDEARNLLRSWASGKLEARLAPYPDSAVPLLVET